MKTTIAYKNHTPEKSDGFYHPDCPVLYAGCDTIGSLDDCPFPLKTDTFRVLLFGSVRQYPDTDAKYGNDQKFVVVEWNKVCGHTVQERVNFIENVQTFDHYGKVFTGESYSIESWVERLEYFRNTPCDVCSLIRHLVWCARERISGNKSSKRAERECLESLNYNFENWQNFITPESLHRRFGVWDDGVNDDERNNKFTGLFEPDNA